MRCLRSRGDLVNPPTERGGGEGEHCFCAEVEDEKRKERGKCAGGERENGEMKQELFHLLSSWQSVGSPFLLLPTYNLTSDKFSPCLSPRPPESLETAAVGGGMPLSSPN